VANALNRAEKEHLCRKRRRGRSISSNNSLKIEDKDTPSAKEESKAWKERGAGGKLLREVALSYRNEWA